MDYEKAYEDLIKLSAKGDVVLQQVWEENKKLNKKIRGMQLELDYEIHKVKVIEGRNEVLDKRIIELEEKLKRCEDE